MPSHPSIQNDAALREFWLACGLGEQAWPAAAERFAQYHDLIAAHNDPAGLMGANWETDFDLKHLADSLAVLRAFPEILAASPAAADVGCGAGLPGIVLAVALPGLSLTAVESNHKKARFVALAVRELGLEDAARIATA